MPDAAVEELTTLYRANRLEDGLLSHQRYVPGAEEHQRFIEGLFGPMFDGDRTPFVDPPTAAYAAARLSLALGAPADHLLDDAVSHLRALARTRTVGAGALPAVLHPFETGTEGSALIQPLFPGGLGASLARFKDLTISSRDAGMAPEAALAAGHGFVVYDPTMCGWYLLALEEVAAVCRARGRGHGGDGVRCRGRGGGPGDGVAALVGRRAPLRRLRPDRVLSTAGHRGHGPDPRGQSHPGTVGPVPEGRRAPPPPWTVRCGGPKASRPAPSPREPGSAPTSSGTVTPSGAPPSTGPTSWPPGSDAGARPAGSATNSPV